MTVDGEAELRGHFALDDFLKPHGLEERIYRLRCVEAWSMVIPWVGIPLADVLQRYRPTSKAKFVEFTTLHDPRQMPGQEYPVLDWPYRERDSQARLRHATDHARPISRLRHVRQLLRIANAAGLREFQVEIRRRILLDELLLLMLRALLILCIALAMVRPAVRKGAAQASGNGVTRLGRTAAVLLLDDSISSSAGRAQPAFESMKKLALAYMDSLAAGDEVSLVLMSQLGTSSGDPGFDLEGLKSIINNLKPSHVGTDIPALLEAGLNQLKRHINPGAELVLVTDGRKDGWHEEDKVRWDDLHARLAGQKKNLYPQPSEPPL